MSSYRVYLPDLNFYEKAVACQFACPVQTDARAYVNAIAWGEYERAYLIARQTNPFASTCGWVCGAPCEAACRRGSIDAPIAIRALKRFVTDQYGVYLGETAEAQQRGSANTYVGPIDRSDLGNSAFPSSRSELAASFSKNKADFSANPTTQKHIAVIGAGPAGLTCAHDLALLGYRVTIFDSAPLAGGMLRLGVPEYRLPRDVIDLEIQAILALGPTLKLNQALGRDFGLADLRKEFDAVFIAIGSYKSRNLNIEGEQLDGVLRAVDFLINVNLGGYNLDMGKRVLVIGGGNVAMDVARTAARLGQSPQSGGDLGTALDVARTAVRMGATQEVHCLVVENRQEMLADPSEIGEAIEEGVMIHTNVSPKRIIGKDGHIFGLETLDVARAFNEQGRFSPQLIEATEKIWECDSVIIAIGQSGELAWVKPEDGLEVTPRGTLMVDKRTLATSAAGVFAGGDIAFGPRLIINAVADGQRAAQSIHAYLQNLQPRLVKKGFFTPLSKTEYPDLGPLRNYLRWPRRQPPIIPVNRRIGVSLVEASYDETVARQQGGRCLICAINPVFDGELCILCNGCVDVCPRDCLKLTSVSSLAGDEIVSAVIRSHAEGSEATSVMLLDPTRCIRCGLCAARCPTEAVRMEEFCFTHEILYEATK